MNIQTIVQDLLKSGYNQKTLADKLTSLGELTNQSTIHRMATNEDYQPKASKVLLLVDLHRKLSPKRRKQSA